MRAGIFTENRAAVQRPCARLRVSTAERQRACKSNEVWSWDFVEDQTENGTRFRILTLLDEHILSEEPQSGMR
jgi:hypothetical protein